MGPFVFYFWIGEKLSTIKLTEAERSVFPRATWASGQDIGIFHSSAFVYLMACGEHEHALSSNGQLSPVIWYRCYHEKGKI